MADVDPDVLDFLGVMVLMDLEIVLLFMTGLYFQFLDFWGNNTIKVDCLVQFVREIGHDVPAVCDFSKT